MQVQNNIYMENIFTIDIHVLELVLVNNRYTLIYTENKIMKTTSKHDI